MRCLPGPPAHLALPLEDLVAELETVGLAVVTTTFDPAAAGFAVVADRVRASEK